MVELSESDRVELLAMLNSTTVSARVATRARIVLWRAEGWLKKDVASRAGVSRPTVDAVLERFAADGVAGLLDKPVRVVQPDRVPARVRARILAVTRCSPTRNGQDFLNFLKEAVRPHAGKEIRIVLDNLSTHTTPDVLAWLEKNPNVTFHFTPVGSSWLNQIETWFGIITRQAIRRGTFSSVKVLIKQIRDYITHWNSSAKPFVWTATANEILAKVRLVEANIKKLVDNNAK